MTMIRSFAALCMVLFVVDAWAQEKADAKPAKQLLAGAAMSNITPWLGEPIVGGFDPQPAKHIHDELHARCVVLDNGEARVAFVICDNVGIPREVFDEAKRRVESETGLAPQNVLMSATHTHSATSARSANRLVPAKEFSEYQMFLIRRIVDGVRRAINNLEPARIGWSRAEEPSQVFNRRWLVDDETLRRNPFGGVDQARMNPPAGDARLKEPVGPTDPEIAFLSVQSTEGRPIALLANYSLHYVGGTAGQAISADYFALFADRMQQLLQADRLDPPFVGIMTNGTSGDVNNINFRAKGQRRAPYEKMREVANLVASKVHEAHQRMEYHEWVPLAAALEELTLVVRKPTPEMLAYVESLQASKPTAFHRNEMAYAERIRLQLQSPDEIKAPLQALRIGELGIAAIPFEVFAEIGLEIKEKSPLRQTFTISLANGSFGYLPTPRQHKLGGYETWLGTNLVETGASDKITASVLRLLEEVK